MAPRLNDKDTYPKRAITHGNLDIIEDYPNSLLSLPKSHFKTVDLFDKYTDIGVVPLCGESKCKNYMIGIL